MRIIQPKNKQSRREGIDLGLKTPGSKAHASLLRKMNVLPGQHGTKRKRKQSERSRQLREKQKLRYLFGITDKQLKRYFEKAIQKRGNTGVILSQLLEKRLDNIIFRLGFTPTRPSARQLVSHRHVKVNDKIVNVASYQISVSDTVTFAKEKTIKIPAIEVSLSNKDTLIPKWLERKNSLGKIVGEPTSDDIEKQINLRSVIEFYSR